MKPCLSATHTQALAERLQMTNPSSTVICRDTGIDKGHISRKHAVEQSKISYLAYCFIRAHLESVHSRVSVLVAERASE